MEYLIDDLASRQLAAEAGLPGGAERAADCAAGLRTDADGGASGTTTAGGIAHQHGLDALPVGKLVDCLCGQPSIGNKHMAAGNRREPEGARHGGSQCDGQIGQVVEAPSRGPMRTGKHLGQPIRRLAAGSEPSGEQVGIDFADRRLCSGERKISHDAP